MANAVRHVLASFNRRQVVVQQIRFYPRWNHRRPVNVYTAEEYESFEKSLNNHQENQSKAKIPRTKQAYRVEQNWQDNLENESTSKSKFPKSFKTDVGRNTEDSAGFKISWQYDKKKKSNATEAPGQYTETTSCTDKPKKQKRPLVASGQKGKNDKLTTTDMLETVIDSEGNLVYTKMKDNDSRVGTMLTEIKSNKLRDKSGLILLEGKRLIKEALISNCVLKYILFSQKDDLNYLKPFLPKIGAHLYKMPYREIQLWSDLQTSPGVMGIFKRPDSESFNPPCSLPFTVICDNFREPGNLGAILRICAGAGCEKVILTKGCVNLWDTKVLRSSAGAHFKLKIQKNVDWDTIEREVGSNSEIFIADNNVVSQVDEDVKKPTAEDALSSQVNLENVMHNVPVLPYYSVDFRSSKRVTLIVGGETYGISDRIYEVASKNNGVRINVPLSNDIESLNVGAALGVIVFEIKRQLTQFKEKS